MANPQKENGYTPIANEIMEALAKHRFGAGEYKVLLILLRKTYGYHKKDDAVSLSQFANMTGLHFVHCSKILKRLLLAKVLTLSNNANGKTKSYCFQKDYSQWTTLSKYANPKHFEPKTLSISSKRPLASGTSTKDIYTKDIQKIVARSDKPKRAYLPDSDFIQFLKDSSAYKGIDIDRELGRMDAWLSTRPGRQKTRRFIVNWLNKIDKPVDCGDLKEKERDAKYAKLLGKT